MSKGGLLCAAALLALLLANQCLANQAGDPEFRAFWVDAWSPGFKSPAEVDKLVYDARACNANALIVQMRRRGDTYYPSPYEPWASDANSSFDALAYTIQKAHGGSPRLEVHFWFTALPIASATWPSNSAHPLNKYPEYISKRNDGEIFDGNNYSFDPGHPGAEQYIHDVIMDVVNRYDVDGIHFDYIRYARFEWGYNDVSIARFNSIYNRTGQPDYTDTAWSNWRRAQVTNLVRKVYANAIAAKPGIKVSAATIGQTPVATSDANWPNAAAYCKYYQDWRAWMEEGILDLNIPMVYFNCSDQWSYYWKWVDFIQDRQYNRAAAIGPNINTNDSACIVQLLNEARTVSPGGRTSTGMSLYCYDGLTEAKKSAIRSVWTTPVSVPAMNWKTAPTKAHIRGTVTFGSAVGIDYANVSLAGAASRTTKTDGTGFYAFIDLMPGNYTVTVTKTGYGTKSADPISVTAGQVGTVNVDFEGGDVVISNVQVTNETSSAATITWSTSVPSTSQVAYGTDRNCSSLIDEDAALVMSHSVTLTGLQPFTAYYYKVISRSARPSMAMSGVRALVTRPAFPDIIIDNPEASLVGSWASGTSAADKYGSNYHYCSAGILPVRYANYIPNITRAGNYRVQVWYPQGSNRTAAAPYTINFNGDSQTYHVNQTSGGGRWNELAVKPFAVGTSGNVSLSNSTTASGNVMADAVRFEYVPETVAPSVPQGLQAQVASHTQINLTWTASTDNIEVAGYRIYRDGNVVGVSYTNSFSDTGLAPNTSYQYRVAAFDTSWNSSAQSASVSRYTLSMPPSSATITCNKPAGAWQTSNPFTFTALSGFGPGTVSYYTYAWTTSPTHTWTGAEWTWAASTRNLYAESGPVPYYLHVRGYNADGIPNGTADMGPYYLDTTAPPAPTVTDEGQFTASPDTLRADWTAADPESGIAGCQYAVGATPGGADLAGWTDTSGDSCEVSIPEQAAGTVIYVSVKARNGAGTWSAVGVSDGITVGLPVATIADAKAMADGCVVSLADVAVTAVFAGCFYVSDGTRVTGLRIDLPVSSAPGARINVAGRLATMSGERRLVNATAEGL